MNLQFTGGTIIRSGNVAPTDLDGLSHADLKSLVLKLLEERPSCGGQLRPTRRDCPAQRRTWPAEYQTQWHGQGDRPTATATGASRGNEITAAQGATQVATAVMPSSASARLAQNSASPSGLPRLTPGIQTSPSPILATISASFPPPTAPTFAPLTNSGRPNHADLKEAIAFEDHLRRPKSHPRR